MATKNLVLIRHAKSSWGDPDLADYDRPLNQRGLRSAPKMGRRLVEHDIDPDALVSSPARRARQTAELIAIELDFPEESILFEPDIYEADQTTLLKLGRGLDDAWQTVIMFGHNPGFTDFGNWLSGESIANLPTCAVLSLEFDGRSWRELRSGGCRVVFYDEPKKASG